MDLGLDGRVVLVTGGSDGLGRATAERLASEGARVAICGRDEGRLEAAAERIGARGGEVLALRADVSSPDDLARLFGAVDERWGRLDGLVNNAGAAAGAAFEDISDPDWTADLEVKLMGAVRTCRLALPLLRAAGGGAILNVLSVAAKAAGASSMPSSVSRGGGLTLTKVLSRELGPEVIRVNAVLVGYIESGQWERTAQRTGRTVAEEHAEAVSALGIPLGRVGRAEEFADVAAFLVSPRSSYVTGTAVNVDGGLSPVV
jgi:NAD(P)-dependent dehydrogenase (short-subunit alcohol dehydrogenase family)